MWQIIATALAVPLLLLAFLSPLYVTTGFRSFHISPNFFSLSFSELIDFALAKSDRAEALHNFFEWKHTVLLELLKATVAFLLANVALIIKFVAFPDPKLLETFPEFTIVGLHWAIAAGILCIFLVIMWLLLRLRRIPIEYAASVRLLDLLR